MEELKITYEVLFDILRREKNREELQALEPDFFAQTQLYLREKQQLAEKGAEDDLEARRHGIQVENIKRILKEVYERRERKLINMALTEVRTRKPIIDKNAILPEELRFFEELTEVLQKTRTDILDSLIAGRTKTFGQTPPEPVPETPPQQEQEEADTVTVRILQPIPKFVGTEMEVYGPFKEDDVAALPSLIANVLIKKGRAEAVDA